MAKFQLAILLVAISLAAAVPFNFDNVEVDNVEFNDDLAMEYLVTYGYVKADAMETFAEVMTKFQKAQGLEATGELDETTKALMKTPRCGLPDYKDGDLSQPYKTNSGYPWTKKALTFKVMAYPTKGSLTDLQVNSILLDSLNKWGDVTPLSFSHVTSGGDLLISFMQSRVHGDCSTAFTSVSVGHAQSPFFNDPGTFHLNEADFTFSVSGTNPLKNIATHEFGHNLGLSHSHLDTAVMYPTLRSFNDLSDDDIKGIQSIYGSAS